VAIPVHGTGLPPALELIVTYQPCTEGEGGICYPPRTRTLRVRAADLAAPPPAPRHLGWTFLGLFGFGLLAAFTPCVYPMIPITLAIVGARGGGMAKGFTRSLALVAGMAVTYSVLGVVAARLGASASAWAQSPRFLVPVSALFGLFALSLFGAFEFRLPQGLQQRLQGSGPRQGHLGAFAMGLVLGPISAPCVGPAIGAVLVAIAQEGRVLLGAAELAVFALGMGVLFLAVGTFSAALPRSGPWLVRLKQGMGVLVLGFAVWNVRLLMPVWTGFALWSLTLLLAAAVLGAFRPAEDLPSGFARGLGLLALALALLLGVRAAEGGLDLVLLPAGARAQPGPAVLSAPSAQAGPWLEQDLEGALAQAKATGRPVLVDVYAEWCADCKELDRKTWPDPEVAAWIQAHAVPVRVDTDRRRRDLLPRLGILSYPTVLLLDGDGKELRRILGFQKPPEMMRFLKG
jgi:thiol:disulfide interchange protein DsbD